MSCRAVILGGLAMLVAWPRSAESTPTGVAAAASRAPLDPPADAPMEPSRVPPRLPPDVATWPRVALPQPPEPLELPWLRPRGSIEVEVGPLFLLRSAYTEAANLYGYAGFSICGQYALQGGAHPIPAIRLGARVGYVACDGGHAYLDRAALSLDAVHVSATVSAIASVRTGPALGLQIGADLDGGVQWTQLRLRAQASSVALFRGALGLRMSLLLGPVVFGMSVALQFAQWSDVAHGGTTLSLVGFAPTVRLGGWF